MMQILQAPFSSQVSENYGDISNTHSSKDVSSDGRKSVDRTTHPCKRETIAEPIEDIFDSEPTVKEVGKISSTRVSVTIDQERRLDSKSRSNAETAKSAEKPPAVDTLSEGRDTDSAVPKPEFKEPKLEKAEKPSPEKIHSTASAAGDTPQSLTSTTEYVQLAHDSSSTLREEDSICNFYRGIQAFQLKAHLVPQQVK